MELLLDRQHFFCEYCRSIYFPPENQDGIRVLEKASDTQCPLCKTPLVYGFIDKTQTLYCQNCQGMLIDQNIFLMVINFLRAKRQQPSIMPPAVNFTELERSINCPNCGQPMSTHLYGGPGNLVVDNCIHCNLLWLDSKELERVIRSPGQERLIQSGDNDE